MQTVGPSAQEVGRSVDLAEQLRVFRRLHPFRQVTVETVRWQYVVGGNGHQTLLLLPGGTRVPEVFLPVLPALESEARVIIPAYPAVSTMAALSDGLAAILDAEGVEHVDVLGHSFGGLVAQCFVRRYPERVARLIPAVTTTPEHLPIPGLVAIAWLSARLPAAFIRTVMRQSLRRWLVPPKEQQDFWYGLLDEILDKRFGKEDLVAAVQELADAITHYRFTSTDLADWPGSILILEATHDEAINTAARRALRDLYPQATVRVFEGAGHAVWISHPKEYVTAVKEFLGKTTRETITQA